MDLDPADLAQDGHRLFEDLSRRRPDRRHVVALRILIKADVVLIVGEKERPALAKHTPASFHLVERDFGRFAPAVRIAGAVDTGQTRARLSQGELRIVLPRRDERRGQGTLIPIDTGGPTAPE